MININFEAPDDTKWDKWNEDCQKQQEILNKSHADGKPEKISELYKERKEYFFDLKGPFHGKCAYCETLIVESQPGDLDHYRPKNRVTQSSANVEITDESGNTASHPGYYWLAYDYRNLLPACKDCNSPYKGNTADGTRVGKWNEFPVKTFRACKPGDECKEEPLILNPCNSDINIEEHIEVDSTGIFRHFTDEGKVTCEVLGLNLREAIIKRRIDAYNDGYNAVILYLLSHLYKNIEQANLQQLKIENYKNGIEPFSAAGRAGIKEKINECNPSLCFLLEGSKE